MNLTRPVFVIDAKIAKANIEKMCIKSSSQGVRLRPHFKTHQNHEVGRWFREYGVTAITVSSIEMAEFFAADGWDDITVAFSVNINEIEKINKLAKTIKLNLLLEDLYVVTYLEEHLEAPVGVYIEIDTGYHRAGLDSKNFEEIGSLLKSITNSKKLECKGFLTFPGHTYTARSEKEIRSIHKAYMSEMTNLRQYFENQYKNLEISVGDTPSCTIVEDFSMVEEIRPGNFVYYDQMQLIIGSCVFSDVATIVACPVVAIHKERQEIIIFAGAVHFSKEQVSTEEKGAYYGDVVELTNNGWTSEKTGSYLSWMTQEHGVVKASKVFLEKVKIGEFIGIIPAHSCLTANLMKKETIIINK